MITYYKNKKTRKVVYITNSDGDMVRVKYILTECQSWFFKKDFDRIFEKIK